MKTYKDGTLQCGARAVSLSAPLVMGILNVTPDSFSDGGRFNSVQAAYDQAAKMVAEGAAFIDIGGESTRPGAAAVSSQEELDRVLPVVEKIHQNLDVVISLDTSNPQLMREGAALGAGMVNDVRALDREGALQAVVDTDVAVCLMHRQGEPQTMQQAPHYDDVVAEVRTYLADKIHTCQQAGVKPGRIVVDPGFGFGKNLTHNLTLMAHLEELLTLPAPMLIGVSRKSMVGAVLDKPVEERLQGSVALAVLSAAQGAHVFRVHDVAPTVEALRMTAAVLKHKGDVR